MAIKVYSKNGKKLYRVYVNKRSTINPRNRFQRKAEAIKTEAKALKLEKEFIYEAGIHLARLDGEGLLWIEVLNKWYNYKLVDTYAPLGKTTLIDYYAALNKWTNSLMQKPAKFINRADVKKIIETVKAEGKSVSFQSKIKGLIKMVFDWGIEEGLIKGVSQPPTIGIKTDRKREKLQPILNRKEIFELLEKAALTENPWHPIWAMALHTGCRSGELYALEWTDIDLTQDTIHIKKSFDKRHRRINKWTKGKKWRTVPINAELKSLLIRLQNEPAQTNFVLPRLRAWRNGYQATEIKKFCLGIGITPINFHALRACFATQLLQNGVAPITVMKVGGWSSLRTMNNYIRVAGIDEQGATESLTFPTDIELGDKIVELFSSRV